ncbi:phosphomannomutase/phosphoglucomutase [Burkholderia gladioli]|jgi:phosphomannomutase/phosphoglucomutase|uniref:Phosphoglucomutase/phosphomannomutase, alpha/beta/alpha domain III family protein n=1 Tax=Burkholderia gladioli TaxID=28095 RepID=A0AAP8V3W5_BURGA|nr:phosphomannomutase/phosphoglucomutase [Burkholderia gladioli]AJW99104.1 phosphoglucomutase/phosphomannomutase, alpha/beta/alpha domain III family protein [Burkholderia gladioli]ASD78267.1 phosphomannomutase/phosphoglucomutase [Burkholderia gladioli pv. gladioli]AWY56491.1 phosphomannomutase/phosphoglucomutase [Burkholderia gladioli pv. gladioli]KGC17529.1 phosphoglucomutase/phosphomannomutase, alpha/beta/alpha domain III family protein [Burkholderia gladioli]MBJ9674700.1 phosphomannomutase/
MISQSIFKAYDIRGVIGKTLDASVARSIGQAFGSEVRAQGGDAVVVARDGRLSGPELIAALADGLRAAGVDVVDVGMVPTPVGYFAASVPLPLASGERRVDSCIVVTGSHNPPDYNGFKMVLRGAAIYGEQIQALYRRIVAQDYAEGSGSYQQHDVADAYLQRIVGDIKLARPLKIVVDTGNGVAGELAPRLFKALGCELVELFTEIDGNFPNHHPDPAHPENLQDVIRALKETDAEIGFAFDGDGDRLGVVTKDGQIIYPDRQMMLFAEEVLSRNPGAQIIYDVKCTRNLAPWIREKGGEPLMWKTGHSLVKAKLRETGAPLAGEMSGHVFFKDRWYGFDDGLYTGARLLEILARVADPSALLNGLPNAESTPELQLKLEEGENVALIEKLRQDAKFEGADEVITIDGLRVEYPDGFGLARSSNTTPVVVLRFEANSADALERIKGEFRRALTAAKPDAKLPF